MSDKTLSDYLTGGWAGLNTEAQAQATNTESAHQQWETAMRIAKPFMSRDGQDALALLREKTIDNATWDPDLGPNAINNGFFREGQNSIVRYVLGCIEKAKEGPPADPNAKPAAPKRVRK